jgi:hypothetical protein
MSELERLEDETNIEPLTVVGDTDDAPETEGTSSGTPTADGADSPSSQLSALEASRFPRR